MRQTRSLDPASMAAVTLRLVEVMYSEVCTPKVGISGSVSHIVAGALASPRKVRRRYQISFTANCIMRLPPVNCLLFKNRLEVTFGYVVLRALFTVPISTPV